MGWFSELRAGWPTSATGARLTEAQVLADLVADLVADGSLGGGSNDGAYHAITHSSNGALALDFNDSTVGFVVTASANITDITISNGPTSGNQKRRTLEVVASASITVAAGSLDVVDGDVPTSMSDTDSFMADLVVTA